MVYLEDTREDHMVRKENLVFKWSIWRTHKKIIWWEKKTSFLNQSQWKTLNFLFGDSRFYLFKLNFLFGGLRIETWKNLIWRVCLIKLFQWIRDDVERVSIPRLIAI
jgi:hypothetical protein